MRDFSSAKDSVETAGLTGRRSGVAWGTIPAARWTFRVARFYSGGCSPGDRSHSLI
ncbi:hypothetical protein [Bradyrhizobium canariense]|uniref:hypothetical protein n=1 Tax=Bradyrhizobium canariense TaxID=255045 RepID=UPI001B8A5257|nr:hypothetical protein [Bradyrhizobium canariense]MBR0954389.1 hypothetical protein [Bradyrhizobium canariense]